MVNYFFNYSLIYVKITLNLRSGILNIVIW